VWRDKWVTGVLLVLLAMLQYRLYLVTSYPTIADLSIAAFSQLLKFPEGQYLNLPESLQGQGVPGLADNPDCEAFFTWRDLLYKQYRRPSHSNPSFESDPAPTSIQIE